MAEALRTPLVANEATVPQQQTMAGAHVQAMPFEVWAASAPPPESRYQIMGDEYSQVLEMDVPPSQRVTAEPGTMVFVGPGITLDTDVGGCGQGCKRCCCARESFFRLHLVNNGATVQRVGLSAEFPAKVVPLDLAEHTGMIINRGAFLAAEGADWRVNVQMVGSMGICCCGGQGLFMNELHGTGTVFLNAGGTVMQKVLGDGEEVIVEPSSVLAFARTVRLGIRRTGGCLVCCCGGQGLFNATLTGPGFVLMHTMSLEKLRKAVAAGGAAAGAAAASL